MKKKLLIISSLLLLTGCADKLDTSKLTVQQASEDQFITFYDAPSLEEAIEAMPFDITLPTVLPFESSGFKSVGITDIGGKLLNVEAAFMASSPDNTLLYVTVDQATREYPDAKPEEIKLSTGHTAFYSSPNNLHVQVGDVSYSFTLNEYNGEEAQIREELIKLAEQVK